MKPNLLTKYPIKNNRWHRYLEHFSAEMSDMTPSILDPWNRPFPSQTPLCHKDDECDILMWEYYTTVEGDRVKCIIFND